MGTGIYLSVAAIFALVFNSLFYWQLWQHDPNNPMIRCAFLAAEWHCLDNAYWWLFDWWASTIDITACFLIAWPQVQWALTRRDI